MRSKHPLGNEPIRTVSASSSWTDMRKAELEHLLRAAGAVPFRTKNTGGVTGWCVEIHDLAVGKLAAGRAKDLAYIRALLKHKLVKRTILEERLADTAMHPHQGDELLQTLRRLAKPKAKRK